MFLIPVFVLLMLLSTNANEVDGWRIGAFIIFLGASATDWFDGYIARRDNLVTNFGKFADPLADKMLVMSAFIMLVSINQVPAWIAAIIICRELAVTGLRTILLEKGQVMAAAKSGKIKTMTQMLAILFLILNDWPLTFTDGKIGTALLYAALLATIYSGYEYFSKNWHIFKSSM